MKSARPAALTPPVRRFVPFREARGRRGEELAFLPAALEIVETPPDRPNDRRHHHPAVLRGAGLGLVGDDRHCRISDRKDRAERSHQGGPAIRDRGGAVHSGGGRAGGQSRRRTDRARSDRQRGGTRSPAQRPHRRTAQHRAAARGTGRRQRSGVRLHTSRRCRSGTGRHPASGLAQPGCRASRQGRRARPSTGAKGSRAIHDRSHRGSSPAPGSPRARAADEPETVCGQAACAGTTARFASAPPPSPPSVHPRSPPLHARPLDLPVPDRSGHRWCFIGDGSTANSPLGLGPLVSEGPDRSPAGACAPARAAKGILRG
jgi:hypothetical protein